MLVNVPNIENNDEATPDLFNSRFADIVDVINGNIEADNIQDNSIPYAKLSIDDAGIPAAKLSLTPTAGTNGSSAGGTTNYIQLGTLLIQWGTTARQNASSSGNDKVITFPVTFATTPTVVAMPDANSSDVGIHLFQRSTPTTTYATLTFVGAGGAASALADWIAIGKAA